MRLRSSEQRSALEPRQRADQGGLPRSPSDGFLAPGHHRCLSLCHYPLEGVPDLTFSWLAGAQMTARDTGHPVASLPRGQPVTPRVWPTGHLRSLPRRTTGSESPSPSTPCAGPGIRAADTVTVFLTPHPPPEPPGVLWPLPDPEHTTNVSALLPSPGLLWFWKLPWGCSKVRPERVTLLYQQSGTRGHPETSVWLISGHRGSPCQAF